MLLLILLRGRSAAKVSLNHRPMLPSMCAPTVFIFAATVFNIARFGTARKLASTFPSCMGKVS